MVKKELSIFLIVGILTVIVDYIFYQGMLSLQLINIELSKAFGFICGTLFSYLANRFWTFNHNKIENKSIVKFFMLYSFTLFINVIMNSLLLNFFMEQRYAFQISFFITTFISATLNFIGMKYLVFNSSNEGKKL